MNSPATRSPVQYFLTAKGSGSHLAPQTALALDGSTLAPQELPHVLVNPGRKFQEVLGFGAAFTEAAAVT